VEKSLRQFLAVAEMKSISRAAKRLFITQPTLTHNMKKLEEELEVSLFVRTPRGIALTSYGELLFEQVRVMQRVHDNAMAELKRFKQKRERGIKVGVGFAWWHLFFRTLWRDYQQAHPLAPVHVEVGNHLRAMDLLLTGEIDLFIGHEIIGLNERSGAEFIHLFSCFDGAFTRPEHPLTQQSACTISDLADYPHLEVTPDEARFAEVIMDPTSKEAQRVYYHLRERVVWSTSSMSTGIDMLLDSNAVMTYTATMRHYFYGKGLVELPMESTGPFQVGIYYLKDRREDVAVSHMMGLIQEYLGRIDHQFFGVMREQT